GLLVVAPALPALECALVLELAEVHELAHGRACHRCHLDQIQVHIGGELKSTFQRDDAHLPPLWADQPYLPGADLLVDAMFDADGASSIREACGSVPASNLRP